MNYRTRTEALRDNKCVYGHHPKLGTNTPAGTFQTSGKEKDYFVVCTGCIANYGDFSDFSATNLLRSWKFVPYVGIWQMTADLGAPIDTAMLRLRDSEVELMRSYVDAPEVTAKHRAMHFDNLARVCDLLNAYPPSYREKILCQECGHPPGRHGFVGCTAIKECPCTGFSSFLPSAENYYDFESNTVKDIDTIIEETIKQQATEVMKI
jgi:hypothetical protein